MVANSPNKAVSLACSLLSNRCCEQKSAMHQTFAATIGSAVIESMCCIVVLPQRKLTKFKLAFNEIRGLPDTVVPIARRAASSATGGHAASPLIAASSSRSRFYAAKRRAACRTISSTLQLVPDIEDGLSDVWGRAVPRIGRPLNSQRSYDIPSVRSQPHF
jgi:hypothetical protein